jgi:tetratricopeptide (TPR) repeat protein
MSGGDPVGADNTISGGIFYGPVLQGRNLQATFHLPAAAPVALAQLPPSVTGFTGRDDELAVLAGLFDPAGTSGPVLVSAVAGLAGVGKTSLAVQAGHAARERGWFGGGVLFIDLHGYDEAPVEPGQALDALLRALWVPAEHIPPTMEERAGLYRSVLAQVGEPVLVIADNASSEAQVRPLLPGTGQHKVLVTSRHTLAGLDARLVDVMVLGEEAAIALLDGALRAARPEDDRITGDQDAAGRLARVCGGLPLALQIVAAMLKSDPTLSAADLAEELTIESMRLQQLRYDDGSGMGGPSVAAAFELSYRRLDETAAQVFRLLPVNPGPDVSIAAAGIMAELPVSAARRVLSRLAQAHLVEVVPGATGRWRMHDLVRLYAQQLSDTHAKSDEREQAWDRLLSFYSEMTREADDHLHAHLGAPVNFTGRDDSLAWLDAERPSLVAAITMAVHTGRNQFALDLPSRLATYLAWRGLFDDWVATAIISLDAARHLGDRRNEGIMLGKLGVALQQAQRLEEAIAAYRDAVPIFRDTGDRYREATAQLNLGAALSVLGRSDEAITAARDAASVYRETGDRHGEAKALHNIGRELRELRRFEEAIAVGKQAVAIYQEVGDRHGESATVNDLGDTFREVRRFQEAIAVYRQALAIAHRQALAIRPETGSRWDGDRWHEACVLFGLGAALQEAGQFDEAITAFKDAATIFGEIGDPDLKRIALGRLKAAGAARRA